MKITGNVNDIYPPPPSHNVMRDLFYMITNFGLSDNNNNDICKISIFKIKIRILFI